MNSSSWKSSTTPSRIDDDEDAVVPMAGFGCGLPIAKAYLAWVGGEIDLVSLPNFGTDVYISLNRIGDAEERTFAGTQIPGREGPWFEPRK